MHHDRSNWMHFFHQGMYAAAIFQVSLEITFVSAWLCRLAYSDSIAFNQAPKSLSLLFQALPYGAIAAPPPSNAGPRSSRGEPRTRDVRGSVEGMARDAGRPPLDDKRARTQ